FFSLVALTLGTFFLLTSFLRRRTTGKLPPGPAPWPVVGNLFQLGSNPHQSLAKLAKIYGPLFGLRFGQIYTVVISSPDLAREVLQKHDQALSGRMSVEATRSFDHEKMSIGFLPAGDLWRNLRKLLKEQMMTSPRLEASRPLREARLKKLLEYLNKSCDEGSSVDITDAAFVTTMNLMWTTFFSSELMQFDSGGSGEFRETIKGITNVFGAPNLADYFPILGPLDPQGIRRKARFHMGKLLDLFGNIIDERLRERSSQQSSKKQDLLEVLLDLRESSAYQLTNNDIRHLFLDLFVGGSATTAMSIEWTMTELLRSPSILKRTQDEMRNLKDQIQESDLPKLPYLQALIKEVFRYHPAGPLLIPHRSESNVEIKGCTIPQHTQIMINIWAMGRDETIWSNPDVFDPERFIDKKIDFKGRDFELIPFSAGRRICPGIPLAITMFPMAVVTFIHDFDWKLEAGVTPEMIDVGEKFGLALHKLTPLKAIP
ncbi:hypothetical protein M569_07814, partial [Genlisea aurea]